MKCNFTIRQLMALFLFIGGAIPTSLIAADVNFISPPDICESAGIQTNLTGGIPTGGVYSGPGVTDNEDGATFTFNPAVSGPGNVTVFYTIMDGSVPFEVCAVITVYEAPDAPQPLSIDVCEGESTLILPVSSGPGCTEFVEIWSESFETDGEGTRYDATLNTIGTPDSYFARVDGTGFSANGGANYTGKVGNYYWAGEYHDSPVVGNTDPSLQIYFAVNDLTVDITGYSSLLFKGLIAANPNSPFSPGTYPAEPNNYLNIFYQINASFLMPLIQFSPSGTGNGLSMDTDFDGVGDCDLLTPQFQEFTVPISGTGNVFSMRMNMHSDAPGEEWAIDHFRIYGEQPASCLFNFYNANPDLGPATLLAGAVSSYDPGTTAVTSPQSIWVTEVNDNGCESPAREVVITVTNDVNVTFTAPTLDVCIEDNIVTGLSGGSPLGGVYSGDGVSDNANGTFDFDPAATSGGFIPVLYSYTGVGGCVGSASDDIYVNPICCETFEINCPPDLFVNNQPGQCGVGIDVPKATVDESCNVIELAARYRMVDAVGNPLSAWSFYSFDPSGFYDVGRWEMQWQAEQAGGATISCSFYINVLDNQAPTGSCQNLTVQLPVSQSVSISGSDIVTNGADNCGPPSLNIVGQSTFDCDDVGQNNSVTVQISDGTNSISCNATVSVIDPNTNCCPAPVASCQDFTAQLNASGNVTINASDIDNGSTADCGLASLTLNDNSYDCSNVGTTTVTLTITDIKGNFDQCIANLTIQDNVAPDAICENEIVVLNASGIGSITAAEVNDGSSDACGIASLSLNQNNFTCADVGDVPVILTVTDVNGQVATCNATVTVVDDIPPTAFCQDATVQIGSGGTAFLSAFAVVGGLVENCSASASVSPNVFDCDQLGAHTVTLTRTDPGGNSSTCTATVTVEDANNNCNQAPIAVCQNITVNANASCQGIAVAADFDGGSIDPDFDPLTFTVNPEGPYALGATNVTLTVDDGNGSQSTCTATVTVEDNVAPAALCQDITVQLNAGGSASINTTDVDGGSGDACGIAGLSVSPSTFGCANVGANSVTLTATDNNGNSSNCSATVTVEDNVAPAALCQDITVQLNAGGSASISGADVDGGSTDACGIASLTANPNNFDCSDIGPHTSTLTVTDNNGNSSTCSATVTVEDNVAPDAQCQDITVQLGANGAASLVAADIDGGSTDNCGIASLAADITTFDCAQEGGGNAVTVTLTVTDVNGNPATCTAQVEVDDNILPVAGCQNITVQLDAGGNASISEDDVESGSTDNCGFTNALSVSPNTFHCNNVGPNTVTLTVGDGNGNHNTCNATVTVEDNVAPAALCQDITVQLNAGGSASISGADVDGGAVDACGIASLSVAPNTFGCANVGANSVTLTATDNNGNSSNCSATVTVQDNVAPTALCQDITVQLNAGGNASINATDVDGGSGDACGNASLSVAPNAFNCANVGANSVTLTATDNNGNSSNCSATVTVEDNVAPAALCQDITVQLNAGGSASISGADVDGGSTDACGIAGLSASPNTFGCANIGANSVTLTATDNNGNSSNCSATVTVEDNVAPVALCQDITVQLNAGGSASISGADVDGGSVDACGIASLSVAPNTFGCANVGANSVTLTATDNNGNSSSCSATVTVQDNVAPTAICQDITVQLSAGGNASINATDVDGGSGDACGNASLSVAPNAFDCANVGANSVTLTATDNNGNSSSCSATVTVEDNVAPVALCQDITVQLNAGGSASISGADVDGGSTDACGIAGLSASPNTFGCANIGANSVTLTATDNNGNSSNCSATVTVEDNVAPVAACQNITVQLSAGGSASISGVDVDGGSVDACGIAGLNVSPSTFGCANVGANSVTLTATDNNGNSSNCSATVTVQDNVAPAVICQDITVQLSAGGNASINATDVDGGSGDACGNASLSVAPNAFGCANVGANSVTLTATDNNGNSSNCSATVTVEDNVAPAALCQDITVQLNAGGSASISGADVDGGSTDACGIAGLSASPNTFGCANIGANSVTLTATDNNGNSSNCSATVTVEDNVAPAALCQDITVQLNAGGSASISGADVDGGSTDACGIAGLSASPNTFGCANVGANSVTLTATDNNGNSSNCSATVTVQDNVAPTALCQDITVQLNAGGNASINATDVDGGSGDACGNASLSVAPNAFGCANVGANSVTLTATDNNGNSSNCSATVTVQDNVAPAALCQDITVQLNAGGSASISGADVDGGSTDACGIAGLSASPNTFGCANIGANSVTLTATDNNGNSSNCSATVTVEDNVAPTALCQDITVQLNVGGNVSITGADVNDGSGDACGVTLSVSPNSYDCTDIGGNPATLTVTDNNGNSSSCTATVTVEDNVGPQANCQNITVQLNANGTASIVAADIDGGSNDACGSVSLSIPPTSFDCTDVGPHTVVLTATDVNSNTGTCNATVTVEDNEKPLILICKGGIIVFNGEEELPSLDGIDFDAIDACGIASVVYSPEVVTCDQVGQLVSVTVTTTDSNGNVSTCSSNVAVDGLPCGWNGFGDDGIGCEDSSYSDYDPNTETFTLESDGCYSTNFTMDDAAYIYSDLCGNGQIVAHVSSLSGQGWAGITMRETENPGSKKVAIMSNLSNFLRREVRTTTNGFSYPQQFFRPGAYWLKLIRNGNLFVGYASADGVNWQLIMSTNVAMNECIQVGLIVTNQNGNGIVSADFDHVEITGAGGFGLSTPATGSGTQQDQPVATILDFQVFPNPASGEVWVNLENYAGKKTAIKVYNKLGQIVLQKNIAEADYQPENIDLNALSNGTYFIEVTTDQSRQIKKLMVVGQRP